jgi:hypothetical protein
VGLEDRQRTLRGCLFGVPTKTGILLQYSCAVYCVLASRCIRCCFWACSAPQARTQHDILSSGGDRLSAAGSAGHALLNVKSNGCCTLTTQLICICIAAAWTSEPGTCLHACRCICSLPVRWQGVGTGCYQVHVLLLNMAASKCTSTRLFISLPLYPRLIITSAAVQRCVGAMLLRCSCRLGVIVCMHCIADPLSIYNQLSLLLAY